MYQFNDVADVRNYLDSLVGVSTTDEIMDVFYKQEKQKEEQQQREIAKNKSIIEHYDYVVEENGDMLDVLEKTRDTLSHIRGVLNTTGLTQKQEVDSLINITIDDINDFVGYSI